MWSGATAKFLLKNGGNMPRKMLLTDNSVGRLSKPPAWERYEVYDQKLRGFLCRVSCGEETGRVKKSLLLRARYPNSIHADKREPTTGNRLNPVKRLYWRVWKDKRRCGSRNCSGLAFSHLKRI
jgi:hypothetical protein